MEFLSVSVSGIGDNGALLNNVKDARVGEAVGRYKRPGDSDEAENKEAIKHDTMLTAGCPTQEGW